MVAAFLFVLGGIIARIVLCVHGCTFHIVLCHAVSLVSYGPEFYRPYVPQWANSPDFYGFHRASMTDSRFLTGPCKKIVQDPSRKYNRYLLNILLGGVN